MLKYLTLATSVCMISALISESALATTVSQEALQLRSENPNIDRALENLRGLNPDHYLKRRRPGPQVVREIDRLRVPM